MIERYTLPEMGALWTDEHRFRTWLKVEISVLQVRADRGEIPADAVAEIARKAVIDVAEIQTIEAQTQHDVIAFVTQVTRRVGPAGRFFHQGLTSSDVVDTALSLVIKDALDLILKSVGRVAARLREMALLHKETVMIGRTHGVHAEPITLGLKLALWYRELKRAEERLRFARTQIGVGKISGAVGTYVSISPDMEQEILARLSLDAAPISSQIVQRDRHAFTVQVLALTAASLEKFATEIRNLARTEIRELEEPFRPGQMGSSAMPHKRNPVKCERICGLARLLRGHVVAAMENVALWHERDISHSSTERIILPDSFIALDYMLQQIDEILADLRVNPERMRRNLDITRGLIFSGRVLTALVGAGLDRDEAYRVVQEEAMHVWEHPEDDLAGRIRARPEVAPVLTGEALDRCFELTDVLMYLDQSLSRALELEGENTCRPW